MADEKNKDQNQDSERNEKAMGATATGAQGQPGGQQNTGRTPQESPGQGGGIQGTGQRNPAQGQDKGDQAGDRGEDFKPTGGGARQRLVRPLFERHPALRHLRSASQHKRRRDSHIRRHAARPPI